MIDLHCHILPGLDDGSRSTEQSVEMARIAAGEGIHQIVATPHLFRENATHLESIPGKLEALNRVLEEEAVGVRLFPGAEVHVSHNLIDEIRRHRERLVINGGSYMIVEFPEEHVFAGVKDLFFSLMSEGITPIIAHPERNAAFSRSPGLLYDLVRMGALCQLNSGSFTGIYGERSEEAAFSLLGLRLVHFVASDGHGVRSVPPRLAAAVEIVADVIGPQEAQALVVDNPRAVLDGSDLPYLPEPLEPHRKQRPLKIKIPRFFKKRRPS